MRKLIYFLLIALASQSVFAAEYSLQFEKTCSYENDAAFQCESKSWTRNLRSNSDKSWIWINEMRGQLKLRVVMVDKNVIVLEGPLRLTHSATDQIHLSKKTGRFYWTEIGYSDNLKLDHVSVGFGKFNVKP